MAYAQFGKDRNWEGYIRVWYGINQSQAGNYTDVEIYDIEYQSIEGRTATWSVCGDITIAGNGADEYFEFWRESFSTYGSGWVSLGNGRSASFRIQHDASGNGSFVVTLYSAGNYNDFNVFHPNGGTYNCEYDSGTSITVTLPNIAPDPSEPTIDLSVDVTDMGVATLTAASNATCKNWMYQTDNGSWLSISGTGTSVTKTLTNMTGTHSYRVKATKTSNNLTGTSPTVTKTTDTSAPTIELSVSVTDMGVATLTASANATCGDWMYRTDSGNWAGIAGTGTSVTKTLTNMTGTHSYQVKATKTSNNVTGTSPTVTKTTDTSAPVIELSVNVTDQGYATIWADARISCTDWAYSTNGGASWIAVSGVRAWIAVEDIPGMTGSHTYWVKATKSSNRQEGYSNKVTKSTDTSAPTISLTATISGTTVTLTASSNDSCSGWGYQIDGGAWNDTSGTATSKAFTIPGMSGTHSFRARATKVSNNVIGYSDTRSTTADTTAPAITATASVNSSGTVTLSATASVSCGSWAYSIDGGEWNGTSGTGTAKTFTIPGMTGAHSFQVRAVSSINGVTGTSEPVSTTTPTLSLSGTAVSTSGSLTISLRYLPANTSVLLKYGNTTLDSYSYSSDQASKSITLNSTALRNLFNATGITTQTSATITVSVSGYTYAASSFTLSSGSNMAPTVGTPSMSIVQAESASTYYPSTYIAGMSSVKVSASVSAAGGASISGVTLSYSTNRVPMSYNGTSGKYEATTAGPISGNTTFTVTATDSRGATGSASASLTNVKSWVAPVIVFDTAYTYRCDSGGNKTEGGAFVVVKVTVNVSGGVAGNAVRDLQFYVKEDGASSKHTLTSGTQSEITPLLNPRPNSIVTIVVETRDKVGGWVTREMPLSGAHRDFALANYYGTSAGRRVTALGIGMAPDTSAGMDTVQLPAVGRFTVGGNEIQNFIGANKYREITGSVLWNKDLLAFDQTNPMSETNETREFDIVSSTFSSWSNIPSIISGQSTDFEGTRMVIMGWDSVFIVILEQTPVPGRIWINVKRTSTSASAWSGWKGHTPNIT